MKKQTFQIFKSNGMYFMACLLGLVFLLAGCESQSDDVQPLGAVTTENTDEARMGMKGMPHKELAQLRAAVARYHNFEHAVADGYDIKLTEHVSQMGFHYLKASLLDGHFEVDRPEALLYVEGPNGKLRFVGVEYAIPIADMNNIPPAPEGFSGDLDVWVVNRTFEIWTLHAWVGLDNPNGIFASHNPRVH